MPDKKYLHKVLAALLESKENDSNALLSTRPQVPECTEAGTALFALSEAISTPYCLEVLLSALSPSSMAVFTNALVYQYPSTFFDPDDPPLAIQCQRIISATLFSLEYPDVLESRKVEKHQEDLRKLARVLEHLREMTFVDNRSRTKGRPRANTSSFAVAPDPALFELVSHSVPHNVKAAKYLVQDLFAEQLDTFKVLLRMIRNTDVAQQTTRKFSFEALSNTSGISIEKTTFNGFLRANLDYTPPVDFGGWVILTTDPFRTKIEKISQSDSKQLTLIWDKLRELSHGVFSPDNFQCITAQSPVEIYQASVHSGLYIVYQIECMQKSEEEITEQVILVYGIFEQKELASLSWDDTGSQQAQRGQEYCAACQYRLEIKGKENVFAPARFPYLNLVVNHEPQEKRTTPLSKAAVREMHSLLVLGKHAILSQPYIDAVIRGADIAPVYIPSQKEREVIDYPESLIVHGRSGTGKTTVAGFRLLGIERAAVEMAEEYQSHPRQVFISKSAMLVRKVERDFFQLARLDALAQDAATHFVNRLKRVQSVDSGSLFTADDLGQWPSHLPKKFSELGDEHFPLFIRTMLAGDFGLLSKSPAGNQSTGGSLSDLYKGLNSFSYITFDDFKANYWPRLPSKLTQTASPAIVFSEFIGVLQGSEDAAQTTGFALSKLNYESSRVKHVSYTDFVTYVKVKRERNEFDIADRTHALLDTLKTELFPGKKIDYLYVDEVQDFLMIDLILLRQMVRNSDGLFLAGDIAQTIALGSSFRFEEATSFLYRYEMELLKHQASGPKRLKHFQLSTNYRSPGGIVNCAHSIVELLQLFPRAIDALDRERGIIEGLKPLLVHHRPGEDVRNAFFSLDSSGRATVKLGANQCILVRDNAARERLKPKLGDMGIILTLYQSKGLEFDDVILCDFFKDSEADEDLWWDLYEKSRDRAQAADLVSSMMFAIEDRRHAPLLQELKLLYVGVTRTRNNLWLLDSSRRVNAIKKYWQDNDIIEVADDSISITGFASQSATQDWLETGLHLWKRRQYEEAALAFERAGDERRARVAGALRFKELADQTPRTPPRPFRDAYLSAAEALMRSANEAREYWNERQGLLTAAADCFSKIGEHARAAKAFEAAERWSQAAAHYFDAKMLDKAVRVVYAAKAKQDDVAPEIQSRIIDTAKYTYLQDARIQEASDLFESYEDFHGFMISHDFPIARAEVLKEADPLESARLFFTEGQVLAAIRLLTDQTDNQEAFALALNLGLQFLFARLSLGSFHLLQNSDTREIDSVFNLLNQLPQSNTFVLGHDQSFAVKCLRAIFYRNVTDLQSLATSALTSSHPEEALLCLDHYFSRFDDIDTSTQSAFTNFVDMFLTYATKLNALIGNNELLDRFSKVLGVQKLEGDDEHIKVTEMSQLGQDLMGPEKASTALSHAPKHIFYPRIWSFLARYLQSKIKQETRFAERHGQILDACMNQSLTGQCRINHPRPVSHDLDENWYNMRARFFLQQVKVIHVLHELPHAESHGKRAHEKREWLARLENALNPLFYLHGSQSLLHAEDAKFTIESFNVLKRWTQDIIYDLNPSRSELQGAFLTNLLNSVKLGLRLEHNGSQIIERTLSSSPCFRRRSLHFETRELYRLARFLTAKGDITDGIEFLAALVERRCPVDFVALCDFIDRLCGLFILTYSFAKIGSLHNVILPRSWIRELWPDLIRFRGKPSSTPARFAEILVKLITDVYNEKISTAYLKHRVTDLRPDAARDACICRISRALCFLGLKVNDASLRDRILHAMSTLWNSEALSGFIPLSLPYLSAESWDRLAHVVLRSCQRSTADQMVQLFSSVAAPNSFPVPQEYVRRVQFKTLESIPSLLRVGDSQFFRPPQAARAQVASAIPSVSTSNAAAQTRGLPDEQMSASSTEAENVAATKIQRSWRSHRPPQRTKDAELYTLIKSCRAQAATLGLETTRLAFIIHLPRLVLGCNWVLTRITQQKAELVKQRKLAELKDVQGIVKRIGCLAPLESRTRKVQKSLALDNPMFKREDALKTLRQSAKNVLNIAEEVAQILGIRPSINDDVDLALRGLENTGRWPLLNADDL